MFSPLEQFEIFTMFVFIFQHQLVTESFFIVSNLDLAYGVSIVMVSLLVFLVVRNFGLFPNYIYSTVQFFFQASLAMLINTIHKQATENISIVNALFILILSLNLIGLIPFGFCVTSQIIITQFLGFFAVGGLTLKGILNLKFKFLNLFVPRNVPLFLLPFLSLIEIVSFLSRMFSLSIRLFANMVAGHALLHILMGALLNIFNLNVISSVVLVSFLFPTLLIFVIMLLEIGIAFLQAYVFVVLFLIYLTDSYKSH